MPSNSTNRLQTETFNVPQAIIPTEILLTLATGPLLFGMLCGKATLDSIKSLGEASEEVFRGDRLPAIPFPDSPQAQTE
ncbi:hypothetical protein H6S82_12100 [Planktothrix sp. FACHB-1355]|uniref:Uncharacterized protein n=1 Tax=Aerosakkonema funiforme FACHB-1375 TaxID=2949571 RepID=A0A926V9V8_9CYAN|nr:MULTISPECIES: hypothetical protein [Oscillatoriales]MBD2179923.1 hypothetical protein [Aerosakkonema funiforme FACHB-1375]MBD3559600.1 hypothetical protein [Planktothrix sp. FACHB-1355]